MKNITVYVEDRFTNNVRKNIQVSVCGNEKVLVNTHDYAHAFVSSASGMPNLIQNFLSWMTSTNPICGVTTWELYTLPNYKLYEENQVTLDVANNQIIVSSQENVHLEFTLKGTTTSLITNFTAFKVDACGKESVQVKNSDTVVLTLDLMQNNTVDVAKKFNLANLTEWFTNSDLACPYLYVKLVNESSLLPQLYDQIEVNTTSMKLLVLTDAPIHHQFILNISTEKQWAIKKFDIKVCGNETVKLKGDKSFFITYDEESDFYLGSTKVADFFESTDERCPIVSYSISFNQSGPGESQLNESSIYINDKKDIMFYYLLMNKTFPVYTEFYILASTAA